MEIMKKRENTVPNIWIAQENLIQFYRLTALGLSVLSAILIIAVFVVSLRDPVVVVRTAGVNEFYVGSRDKSPLGKQEVESFTRTFLAALYVWSGFDPDKLRRDLATLADEGLVEKIIGGQNLKYGRELKGKKLAQAISFVGVQVLDDRVIARFDRILKIEGIPLVIPTEASISMVQGAQTRSNPVGIYVTGIVEREGAK